MAGSEGVSGPSCGCPMERMGCCMTWAAVRAVKAAVVSVRMETIVLMCEYDDGSMMCVKC